MKLVHVVPIARSKLQGDSLSYFSTQAFPVGSVISVPIRTRDVPAIVIKNEEVHDAKSRIRGSGYSIKKIRSRTSRTLFPQEVIRAAEHLSLYYAVSLPNVLFHVFPQTILDNSQSVQEINRNTSTIKDGVQVEKMVYQAERSERIEEYKNIIRGEFAQKKSVYLSTPTMQDAEDIIQKVDKGIEQYVHLLHGGLTKKQTIETWNKIQKEQHAVLIVGTPLFACIPRDDFGTLIIEREQSSNYVSMIDPAIDMRRYLEKISEERKAKVIRADNPLSIDTIYRFQQGKLDEFAPLRNRIPTKTTVTLTDMRTKEESGEKKKPFSVFDHTTILKIKDALEKEKKVVLFAARKGLAPITVCEDCGNTVKDEVTETPMVLYKGAKENVFVSHASGTIRSAHERCKYCTSWKLKALGIGIERVVEETKEIFEGTKTLVLDKTSAKTHKQAQKIAEQFKETDGTILIGTEMMLPYIHDLTDIVVVVSMDSLLSIPEWNAYERIFSIVMRLRESAHDELILQTRMPEQYILETSLHGLVSDFYKEELAVRKRFKYPPYGKLLRVSLRGSKPSVLKETLEKLEGKIGRPLDGISHPINLGKGKYLLHGYIRFERTEWPDHAIVQKLKNLPPDFSVTIDPSSIL